GAFDRCEQLKELVIPEGVRNIGDTFAGCVSLEKIVLPKSLQYIFPGSFFRCVSLKSIIYNGTVRQWKKLMKAWEGLVIDGEQIRAGIEQALAGTSYAERISEKQDGGFNPPTNVAICSDGEAEISWLIK
ncbi:MAG: leucine-rich repeat domain-containing protein, partial [Clostridia bacterium]|nr:leucine-rich repeat domain-containing protein [Clostridia bacterium]